MRGKLDLLEPLLLVVANWARSRPDVLGLSVVGSYARGTARPDSDLDLMLFARDPATLHADQVWPGAIAWDRAGRQLLSWRDAEYGVVWSRHMRLAGGPEVEMGIGPQTWAATAPVDPGTFRVVAEGCRVLLDPFHHFSALIRYVREG